MIKNRKIDVILIKEFYSWNGRILDIDSWRTYFVPDNKKAAVVLVNEREDALFIREL